MAHRVSRRRGERAESGCAVNESMAEGALDSRPAKKTLTGSEVVTRASGMPPATAYRPAKRTWAVRRACWFRSGQSSTYALSNRQRRCLRSRTSMGLLGERIGIAVRRREKRRLHVAAGDRRLGRFLNP